MLRYFLVLLTLYFGILDSYGQIWDHEPECSTDTMLVEPYVNSQPLIIKNQQYLRDSIMFKPYKIVKCSTRSKIGLREEVSVSKYYYNKKTADWSGKHPSLNVNYIFTIDRMNFGVRFKIWTISPKAEMDFDGKILPKEARLNSAKLDYYAGYSFDFKNLISFEPYAGYNRSLFYVVNEDKIKQEFKLHKTGGLIIGSTVNKYIEIKRYGYLSLFGSLGYGFVNYEKVNSQLDNGYFEWNLGIALKGYVLKQLHNKIE